MAERPSGSSRLRADLLGTTRLTPAHREALIHPDGAPLRARPKDETLEPALARTEELLGQGLFGAALQALAPLGGSAMAPDYAFLRQEKSARAHLGIADQYFIRGEAEGARRFYVQALETAGADPAVRPVAAAASAAFEALRERRQSLIDQLCESLRAGELARWREQERELRRTSLLDDPGIRQRVAPDFLPERLFAGPLPFPVSPGYLEPLAPESPLVDRPPSVPGAVFRSPAAVEVSPTGDQRLGATLAMPLITDLWLAKMRLFGLDKGLDLAGHSRGTVPLFRYEHLRDAARRTIAQIQQIETRMLPIQFELDDFAELEDAIRRPLAEQTAELEAVKRRIDDLLAQLTTLVQVEKALDEVGVALHEAEDECDCDWWCWASAILCFLGATIIFIAGVLATLSLTAAGLPVAALIVEVLAGIGAGTLLSAGLETLNCENVGEIARRFDTALAGVRQGIDETKAELNHALMRRDWLVAQIANLNQALTAVHQSNAARVLDARTLDLIQSRYHALRQSLLARAQELAVLAQDAFNFERDSELRLIRVSYFDHGRKDWSAAETLARDLDGLDYADLTGRSQKALQLSHTVSLRRHYPLSFLALRMAGRARFTTSLEEFDRWFPGTYQQRIREVRVEVLIDGEPAPVRGYLSNDGVSLARFRDPDDRRAVDDAHVFAEPDPELSAMGYKRLQRRRHVDTQAFPAFDSALYEERMRQLQARERNAFENVGLEGTWQIELLPEQATDLAGLTDVRIHFQYEAQFDDSLKRVLERKRHAGRQEMLAVPIRQRLAEEGRDADFSAGVAFSVPLQHLEAPALTRRIVDAGIAIRPRAGLELGCPVSLEVSCDGAPPIALATDANGIVATSSAGQSTGTGAAELAAISQGKGLERPWSVKVTALPPGLALDDLEEVFLLLNYETA